MAQLNDLLVTGNSRFLNEINGQIDWSNVLSKPTIPTVTDTYNATDTDATSGKAVAAALGTLDGTVSGTAGASKTLTAFSQTDGKVSATFSNISITKSQVSDFPTLGTASTKDVPSSGNASTTQVVMGNDTRLTNARPSSDVVQTYSSTSTVPISGKGVAAALANIVGTDEKVTQTESTTNAEYEITFAGSTGTTTTTEGVGKSEYFKFNPSKRAFTLGTRASGSTVGNYSLAVGYNITASGANSYAEGWYTTASGTYSHAEGSNAVSSGLASHVEGNHTTASGYYTHVEGNYTIANHASQHVFGEYNIADPSTAAASGRGTYIEIVGNGTASSAASRANARTLDWSGTEWLAGNLDLGGTTSDIVLSGTGNTWDGTNTSLKTSIVNAGKTKVIQGILRRDFGEFDDDILIPLDTVFELGYDYILEVDVPDGSGGGYFYKQVTLKFRLENVTVDDYTDGNGDKIIYRFSCTNTPNSTMSKELNDFTRMCNYYSFISFSTLNGSPSETYTKDGVTYWQSDNYILQTDSNYALKEAVDTLKEEKFPYSGGTLDGSVTLPAGLWYEPGNTSYGINANNSDIINLNGLYFGDATDSGGEGINFYRNSNHWDTLISENGWLKVKEYRENNATSYSNLFIIPYGIQPIKFAVGTVVRTIPATTAYTLFNATQMKELLKTTTTVSASNCVVWVMNGDDAAQSGRDITANYWNSTNLNVRFRTTTNAGAYRFNYLIAFWG